VSQTLYRDVLNGRSTLAGEGANDTNVLAARPLLQHNLLYAEVAPFQGFTDGLTTDDGGGVAFQFCVHG
jgi:hypothetical protein